MSTSVKYFDSEMPGAAGLVGNAAGSLIAILDECLVDGRGLVPCTINVSAGIATATVTGGHVFQAGVVALVAGAGTAAINGEKRVTSTATNSVVFPAPGVADGAVPGTITIKLAPAGWAKSFASSGKAAYRSLDPSASGCYARIDDSGAGSSSYANLVGYDSMTDIDTGVNPNPPSSLEALGWRVFKSSSPNSTPCKWIVVADKKRVFILTAYHQSYPNDYAIAGWGDLVSDKQGDAYQFLTFGMQSSYGVQTTPSGNNYIVTAGSQYVSIARNYSQSGGSMQCRSYIPGSIETTSGGSGNPIGPSVVNGAIYVCPVLIQEGMSSSAPVRGRLPGIYHLPQYVGASYDTKSIITGVDGLVGRSLMGIRTGSLYAVGGYRYMLDVTGPWD